MAFDEDAPFPKWSVPNWGEVQVVSPGLPNFILILPLSVVSIFVF